MSEAGAFVRFEARGELYALPLLEVREVAPPGLISRVPNAPACTVGVMNHHGRVVTIVDLVALLGGGVAQPPDLCVLLDDGQRRLGLAVTAVEGVGPLVEVEEGIARIGDRAVTILSRAGLFETVDLAFAQNHVLESGTLTEGER